MGLSSSQGRLLLLTSRLSDIQLQETLLSQRQNQLAMDSMEAANKYNKAMNNYKITMKVPDQTDEKGYSKEPLSYEKLCALGYIVVDGNNQIYLTQSEDGKWVVPKDSDGNSLMEIEGNTATIAGKQYNIANGNDYLKDQSVLQNAIIHANLFLINTKNPYSDAMDISDLAADTGFEYELDTSDDAQAESEYEYKLAQVSRQDNMLETEIKQLETQHNAVIKEIDSVKEVINNNVERTFKLFSNG